MEVLTAVGPIRVIHPREMISLISKEDIGKPVYEYSYHTDSIAPFPSTGALDVEYTSQTKQIEHYHNLEHFVLDSFTKDLRNSDSKILLSETISFEDAVDAAACECMQQYGDPTHALLFSPNVIIVGQFDHSTISLKEIRPNMGTLVVYKPHRFIVAYSPNSCLRLNVEPKYREFVSDVTIMKTMERLGLS